MRNILYVQVMKCHPQEKASRMFARTSCGLLAVASQVDLARIFHS